MDDDSDVTDQQTKSLVTALFHFEFDVIYCTGTRHRVADSSVQIRTTGTDQTPAVDDIPVLCITFSNPTKVRGGFSYIHDNDMNYEKDVGFSALCTTATSTEPEQDYWQISTQDFIYEKTEDLDFRQTSSTTVLLRSTYKYDENRFSTSVVPINDSIWKVVPYPTTSTCSISLSISTFCSTFEWKLYVRQY